MSPDNYKKYLFKESVDIMKKNKLKIMNRDL